MAMLAAAPVMQAAMTATRDACSVLLVELPLLRAAVITWVELGAGDGTDWDAVTAGVGFCVATEVATGVATGLATGVATGVGIGVMMAGAGEGALGGVLEAGKILPLTYTHRQLARSSFW
jgi:hypothetical protein